jgi:hypothetical protein
MHFVFPCADPAWITSHVANITAFPIEYDFSESGEFKEIRVNTGATPQIGSASSNIIN